MSLDNKGSKVLNSEERLKLDHLIKNADNYHDNTDTIRRIKHSKQLITAVGVIERLKIHYSDIYKTNLEEFKEICRSKCGFFYNNYTDVFNKLLNDELDLQILSQFLQVLRAIEEGLVDQQEGSVIVGKLLKELYVDAALKRGAKLNDRYYEEHSDGVGKDGVDKDGKETPESRGISWVDYKRNKDFINSCGSSSVGSSSGGY